MNLETMRKYVKIDIKMMPAHEGLTSDKVISVERLYHYRLVTIQSDEELNNIVNQSIDDFRIWTCSAEYHVRHERKEYWENYWESKEICIFIVANDVETIYRLLDEHIQTVSELILPTSNNRLNYMEIKT